VFLAGVIALGFCFALAGRANAQFPILPPPPDFVLSGLSESMTLDSIGVTPISCLSGPAVVSDYYRAKVKLSGIGGDFLRDLTNNTVFIGFVPSCSSVADNAFVIPPGALHMKKGKGSFEASVPDAVRGPLSGQSDIFGFVSVNVSIKGKSGTLTIDGNADLCPILTDAVLNGVQVCLFVDVSQGAGEPDEGATIPDADDIGCTCATPTVSFLDYTGTIL
jgi:hypothetical protein